MKTFSDKVREARAALNLNQQQLGDKVGVSKRSVAAYETTGIKPRGNTSRKLAAALKVSLDYLLTDGIDDPRHGLEKEPYLDEAREKYGPRAVKELDLLLEQNKSLFAGGAFDQESKDAFFEAVMKAYLTCKDEARKTYGRKRMAQAE
ncbi:MAG: helix-turn-helix domain-containing protein [Gracilibacteraceae bacterium]|jgi:transcriptional regulator with XRE-family HTH domain|nr:helix-turn-helix domain-containing protein [Gracilibacteraceae bacterium]